MACCSWDLQELTGKFFDQVETGWPALEEPVGLSLYFFGFFPNLNCLLSCFAIFAPSGGFADNFLYGETRRKNALPFKVLMGM